MNSVQSRVELHDEDINDIVEETLEEEIRRNAGF